MRPQFADTLGSLMQLQNTLTAHPGRIKERLLAGLNDATPLVSGEGLPDDLREIWSEIYTQLTAEGDYRASISRMDEESVVALVHRLQELNHTGYERYIKTRDQIG